MLLVEYFQVGLIKHMPSTVKQTHVHNNKDRSLKIKSHLKLLVVPYNQLSVVLCHQHNHHRVEVILMPETITKKMEINNLIEIQMGQVITITEVVRLLREVKMEVNPKVQEELLGRLEELILLREVQQEHKAETAQVQITHLKGEVARLNHL